MNANLLCPSPHISAEELEGDTVVTIKRCSFEEVGTEQVDKAVVHFDEFDRGFVLNKTNVGRIIALHGNQTEDWKGKQITLYASETDFNGKVVPCIRVREK